MVETVILVLILVAQIYRIVRSEVLLKQERDLHKKIEEHLGTLTPAGLWPQYEALKKWFEETSEKLAKAEADLDKANAWVRNQEAISTVIYEHYKATSKILSVAYRELQEIKDSASPSASMSPSTSPSSSASPSS